MKLLKILLFAGTTEGRDIAEHLAASNIDTMIFVATEYGGELLPNSDKLSIKVGRLDTREMKALLTDEKKANENIIVIDATHPYAEIVTANIKEAAKKTGIAYYRLLRKSTDKTASRTESSIMNAVEYLNKTDGNILLTTGSKDLEAFTHVANFSTRIYPRILPSKESLDKTLALGYQNKNIICMQGPFSKEFNIALLKQINAKYLVTKDTGMTGGFDEKISAAVECGVEAIVIDRPTVEIGYAYDELIYLLEKKYAVRKVLEKSNSFFPIFIAVANADILVVGGGNIAQRRIDILLTFGAKIKVIAPKTTEHLKQLALTKIIDIEYRDFIESDISKNYIFVIAATDNRAVNNLIGVTAKRLSISVSVADNKEESSFYFPAIVRGAGTILGVISEDGRDHELVKKTAKRFRESLR